MSGTVVEESSPPLKYKIWTLKVSVHCEGCKKKVKKILHNIDGVYATDIDLRQQKATVIGDVDAQTLIKKLVKKTGKHAGLWPEKSLPKDNNKQSKPKNKDNQDGGDGEKNDHGQKEPEEPKSDAPHSNCGCSSAAGGGGGGPPAKGGDGIVPVKTSEGDGGSPAKNSRDGAAANPEARRTKTVTFASQPPAPESGGGEEKFPEPASGNADKNKKKKGQRVTFQDAVPASGTPPSTGFVPPSYPTAQTATVNAHQATHSPPRQHSHQYPPPSHHVGPAAVSSYNTAAYVQSSHGASYYAPPQCSYTYAYQAHPDVETEPRGSNLEPYPTQSNSLEMFSDENPNACCVV